MHGAAEAVAVGICQLGPKHVLARFHAVLFIPFYRRLRSCLSLIAYGKG